MWLEELPNVLWAYRTTAKTLTGETPFKLNYGAEAVVPIKVGITSMKREFFLGGNIDYQLKFNLDCLDKTREEASKRMNKYQQKMTEYYNKRVKLRRLRRFRFTQNHTSNKGLSKSSNQLGKDPTRSSTSQDKEVITWNRWMGRDSQPWNIEHLKRYHH